MPLAAQMNEVEALPQMMLRQVANDVGLRPMKLRFAQTELDRSLGFDSKVFRNFVDAFQRRALLGASFRVCRQIRTSESLPPGGRWHAERDGRSLRYFEI